MKRLLCGLLLISGGIVYGMEKPSGKPASPKSLQELALDKSVKEIEEALLQKDISIEELPEYFQQRGMLVGHYLPIVYRLLLTSDMLTVAEKAQLAQVFAGLEDVDELTKKNLEFLHKVLSEEAYAADQTYKGTLINELLITVSPSEEESEEMLGEEIEIPKTKTTLLGQAAAENLYSLVVQLLQEGADVMAGENDGHTPLHSAAEEGHLDIIKLLLDKGADINAKSVQGHTPLYEVVSNKKLKNTREVMDFLFQHGATLDAQDNSGFPLIIVAAQAGNKQAVEFLIDHGIDPNIPADVTIMTGNDGVRAIHEAVSNDNLDMIQFLLDKGADINAKDALGWTPLHWAISVYLPKIAEFLIQKGASLTIKNDHGQTPLDYALSLRAQALPGFKPLANLKIIQFLLCNETITDEMLAQEQAEATTSEEETEG